MNPIPCSEVACARMMKNIPAIDRAPCIGTRCSQWIPRTVGSPPAENVGVCADNGHRLMVDGGAK